MTLQNRLAVTGVWIPYPNAGVKTTRRDSLAVKGDCIDLAEMTRERPQATPFGNTPYPGGRVIASRNYQVPVDSKAPDTSLVTDQDASAHSGGKIPDSQRGIS